MVDEAFRDLSRALAAAYASTGRPGVASERLLKALLLQSLNSIRSERELCRRLKTGLPLRWFLDTAPDEEVFVPTVFTHNRERLAEHGLTGRSSRAWRGRRSMRGWPATGTSRSTVG